MASSPFRPSGYNAACPYLIVNDAAATFLERSFGATVLSRHPDEAGRLRHAEVRIDDSIVMLADSAPEWPPMPSNVHVYVPDVDDTYARALAAGGESVQEPVRKATKTSAGVSRTWEAPPGGSRHAKWTDRPRPRQCCAGASTAWGPLRAASVRRELCTVVREGTLGT